MVRKRKKHEEEKPWCFYCDREFNDENDLILHQKNKHFKCSVCNKRLSTAKALTVHSLQVHKVTVREIPDAKNGREDPTWDIFGSAGIPPGMQRGQDPPKPGAALAPAPRGAPPMPMSMPMQGGGPPPYGMPPPRPYGSGPPPPHTFYGGPRPGGPFGMPPPPGQRPYPGAPPPYGMPPPPHHFPRPGFPPGGMGAGMPPPHMHMPPFPRGPPPPGMPLPPHAYHPGMPPHAHGGPGRPMQPFPGGMPPFPVGAPPPYHPGTGGPGAAAHPAAMPAAAPTDTNAPSAAAVQDGIELIWADEEVSMEERRASLPRYSAVSPTAAGGQQA